MNDVFITSTFTSQWNVAFNPKLRKALEKRGLSCYSPERDTKQEGSSEEIFNQNIEGIKNSNRILCVAINESPNWGGEVGFAYGIGKKIIALTSKKHEIPLMLKGMVSTIVEVNDMDKIETYADDLIKEIEK